MTNEDIDALVQQLKSITNCLYGVGADADSVYERLDKLAEAGRLGIAVEAIKEQYPERDKIRCSIAIINVLYPPA